MRLIATMALAFGLTACGGSGGDSAPPLRLDGLYTGLIQGSGTSATVLLAIDKNNVARFLNITDRVIGSANISVNGQNFSGQTRFYDGDSGEFTLTGSVSGTGITAGGFTAVITDVGTANGTFEYEREDYEKPSSLAIVVGTYQATFPEGPSITITIANNGSINGSTSTSCTIQGGISVKDPTRNLYDLTIVRSCSSGVENFTGFGSIISDQNQTTLFVIANNAQVAFSAGFVKQ